MSTVTLDKIQDSPTWGALYLQYFEQLKQVRKKKNTTLQIDKKLFIEKTTAKGKELLPIDKELHLGDKIIVRLTVTLDRDMEYLHIKDLRAACFEPVEQISGNQWKYGTCYYEEIKDGITNFLSITWPKAAILLNMPYGSIKREHTRTAWQPSNVCMHRSLSLTALRQI